MNRRLIATGIILLLVALVLLLVGPPDDAWTASVGAVYTGTVGAIGLAALVYGLLKP
jgi:hypothetical protein